MKFEKILVAEDQQMANLSLRITLEDLELPKPQYAYYCDDAFKLISIACRDGRPYDLLATDLYFEADTMKQQLANGMELIKAAKDLQPDLKILVFSAESRQAMIRDLYDGLAIDGFVRKGRGDAQELKKALEKIAGNRKYYPRDYSFSPAQDNQHNFSEYDKTVIGLMAQGLSQKEISVWLEQHSISPSSLSSIEKRLNFIKSSMNYKKNEQLVAFCTEMGMI